MQRQFGPWLLTTVGVVVGCSFLLFLPGLVVPGEHGQAPGTGRIGPLATPGSGPLQVVSFSFSPGSVASGSPTQGMIQLSGGVTPYRAWMNNSPPGCQSNTVPYVTSNSTTTFSCHPNGPGTFQVHLDVVDSGSPVSRVSSSATLQVNSNNGNGNSNGSGKSNGSGGFSLPSGLFGVLTIFAVVFLGAMIAVAAGVIAVAVSVSRRLRQINETLAAQSSTRINPPPGK
ncbi:MAG: hypothetical protein L3J97_02605 [Thermoplasmata archaeon]|nr:hypothetical protein [Thermoplasmata archaeon]